MKIQWSHGKYFGEVAVANLQLKQKWFPRWKCSCDFPSTFNNCIIPVLCQLLKPSLSSLTTDLLSGSHFVILTLHFLILGLNIALNLPTFSVIPWAKTQVEQIQKNFKKLNWKKLKFTAVFLSLIDFTSYLVLKSTFNSKMLVL